MEFYQELFLTAVISVVLVFLIGKLAAIGASSDDPDHGDEHKVGLRSDQTEKPVISAGGSGAVGIVEETPEGSGKGEVLESKTEVAGGSHGESFDLGSEDAGGFGFSATESSEVNEERGLAEEIVAVEKREERGSDAIEVRAEEPEEGVSSNDEVVIEKVVRLHKEEAEEKERGGVGEEEVSLLDEEEWEGIERSDLEKLFGAATAYVGSTDGGVALSKLSSDEQMQLYGLRKVATEGPCYEPQPMALKVAARAKWNAWQRLGNMNPEVAMEQYISLLSESIPGWMGEKPRGNAKHDEGNDTLEVEACGIDMSSDLKFSKHEELASEFGRKSEDPSHVKAESVTAGTEHFEQGLTKSFLLNMLSPTTLTFLSLLR